MRVPELQTTRKGQLLTIITDIFPENCNIRMLNL